MTWKRMIWVMAILMAAAWGAVFFFVSRQEIPGRFQTVMGVRSIFPAGGFSPVAGARNGWQGFAFAGKFRFFRRASPQAGDDLRRLKWENFRSSPLQVDLDLFDGGFYVLQRAGKGYRMFCVFRCGGVNYWADMASASSLDSRRRAFERFIVHMEIEGKRASPAVAGQIVSLQRRISPFLIQTPWMLLGLMAGGLLFALLLTVVVQRFSGSCPRRFDWPVDACTPGATLVIRRLGRRRVAACCLCREGESLVIYRFRRPFMKIDIRHERQDIVWEKRSFRYKDFRVILEEEEFREWQLRLMA